MDASGVEVGYTVGGCFGALSVGWILRVDDHVIVVNTCLDPSHICKSVPVPSEDGGAQTWGIYGTKEV